MSDSDRAKRFHDEKWEAIQNSLRLARETRTEMFDQHIALSSIEGKLKFLSGTIGSDEKPIIESDHARNTARETMIAVNQVRKAIMAIMREHGEQLEKKLLG
ncbi:hypothetical protein CMI37_27935 [Candidatus Pacearchaeota archaeon]|nr:hypothetical protein [Candidatus Pacearchaeota archaeon]|tara:strand:+ start:781 stop:1086 length:306 start_codon:yes stop_codon:yes gene_type:complete